LTRADFVVAEGNRDALSFIESWPGWTIAAAALYGPAACGKSHLAAIWGARSGAQSVAAAALSGSAFVMLDRSRPVVIEDVDSSLPNPARDAAIFDLIESATSANPVLLTGRREPGAWTTALPDLASRFGALVSFSLWAADDVLLLRLAQKLFSDRQIAVPDFAVEQILRSLERSPAAIRALVARADAKALAEGRAVTSGLLRELLMELGPAAGMTDSPNSFNFGHEVPADSGHGERTA
jgi:chromosomal replication initiation ATPase DnaA